MKIREFLKKKVKTKLIQAKVDELLVDQVRAKLKKENVQMQELISASFKAFLQE